MSEEREAFERVYAIPNKLPIDRVVSNERYCSMETEHAFRAWQAGRQSAGATRQEPVLTVKDADEYGPIIEWKKHWVELIGANLYAAPIGDNRAEIESEQRRKMQERFAQRPQTPASADFDLPAPNDVIGDNGATEKIPPVIYNGDTKRDPALKERLQLQAQPTESRQVELTEDERADIRTAAAIARHAAHGFLADRLEALARDQAKGE